MKCLFIQAEAAASAAKKAAAAQSRPKPKEEVSLLYDTLSQKQQYRYCCFRRSGFASKPIERFVAKTLIDEAEKRYLGRKGAMDGLGFTPLGQADNAIRNGTHSENSDACKKRKKQNTTDLLVEGAKKRRSARDQPLPYFLRGCHSGSGMIGNASTGGLERILPLENLVVPNSASEIVAVVSTLAKCYAQRLVAAAKRVADADETEHGVDEISSNSPCTTQKPLLSHHLLEAHRRRSRAGIDPGFWIADRTDGSKSGAALKNGGVGIAEAAALGRVDRDRTCYLAALAAQDAFDREVGDGDGDMIRQINDNNRKVKDI